MADSDVKKQITFDGLKYNLDDRDRVAVKAAWLSGKSVLSGSGDVGASAASGEVFATSSLAVSASFAGGSTDDNYLVLCIKK